MQLEDLLLTRDEIPIGGPILPTRPEFSHPGFVVPIHHSLRDAIPDDLKHDKGLAYSVLNDAIDWYTEDLTRYYKSLGNDNSTQEWIKRAFMDSLPEKQDEWNQFRSNLGGGWTVYMVLSQGFLYSLGLTVHCHIYSDTGSFHHNSVNSFEAKMTKEKFIEYSIDGDVRDLDGNYFSDMYAWHTHNVDTIPEAIMLRNWAILYENKLLEQMDARNLLEYRT